MAERFKDVDLVISCGDLPYYYVEFLVEVMEKPVFFVRGNHAHEVEFSSEGFERKEPWGAIDLHRKVRNHKGLLLLGFEGSIRYRKGLFMYTQSDMWFMVLGVIPRLIWNRIRHGRFLDVLVTHSPAWDLQDAPDPAHRGFKAFRWLLKVFRPRYHFHGHIHIYNKSTPNQTQFGKTLVINTYGYRQTELDIPELGKHNG